LTDLRTASMRVGWTSWESIDRDASMTSMTDARLTATATSVCGLASASASVAAASASSSAGRRRRQTLATGTTPASVATAGKRSAWRRRRPR
jgi:hypothetical protein